MVEHVRSTTFWKIVGAGGLCVVGLATMAGNTALDVRAQGQQMEANKVVVAMATKDHDKLNTLINEVKHLADSVDDLGEKVEESQDKQQEQLNEILRRLP